jgi:hypothetical protein
MRRSLDSKALAGSLALLLALLLSLPGVRAVRAAGNETAAETSDGPMCTQPGAEVEVTQIGPIYQQVLDQIAAQMGPEAANAPIVLNNRGYNYAAGQGLERSLVEIERARAPR